MKTHYFTFGKCVVHSVAGKTFDSNVIVKITDENPRQKMFEYFGYEVKVLKRVQHATIRLDGLKRGDVKPLKPAQIKELKNFLNRISK